MTYTAYPVTKAIARLTSCPRESRRVMNLAFLTQAYCLYSWKKLILSSRFTIHPFSLKLEDTKNKTLTELSLRAMDAIKTVVKLHKHHTDEELDAIVLQQGSPYALTYQAGKKTYLTTELISTWANSYYQDVLKPDLYQS